MESVKVALYSVKKKLRLIALVHAALWGVAAFLGFFAAGSFFSLDWKIPAVLGVVSFLFIFFRGVKRIRLQEAEQRIPQMEWQLRTAEDTADKNNEVIDTLHRDVMERVKLLSTSALFDRRRLVKQASLIVVLLLLVVAVPRAHLTAENLKEQVVTGFATLTGNSKSLADSDGDSLSDEEQREIYGTPKKIRDGDVDVDIELQRAQGELDLDKKQREQGLFFSKESSVTDPGVRADTSYEENLGDNKDLVERYFKNLAEGSG